MTLEHAQAQLDAWLAASLALADGKEHQVADRRVRLEDGAEVRQQIAFWQQQVNRLTLSAAGVATGSLGYATADFSAE